MINYAEKLANLESLEMMLQVQKETRDIDPNAKLRKLQKEVKEEERLQRERELRELQTHKIVPAVKKKTSSKPMVSARHSEKKRPPAKHAFIEAASPDEEEGGESDNGSISHFKQLLDSSPDPGK
jgi:hypothetical protein